MVRGTRQEQFEAVEIHHQAAFHEAYHRIRPARHALILTSLTTAHPHSYFRLHDYAQVHVANPNSSPNPDPNPDPDPDPDPDPNLEPKPKPEPSPALALTHTTWAHAIR